MSTTSPSSPDPRIQPLADVLSIVALVGGLNPAAVQQVLAALAANLSPTPGLAPITPDLTAQLLAAVARAEGQLAAIGLAADLRFAAGAWRPVLDAYPITSAHRTVPYAEAMFALADHTGYTLYHHGAFDRYGGPERVLPLPQLTAALAGYPLPRPGLTWEMVGFDDPPDQALVAGDASALFLFKAAATERVLRLSEHARNDESGPHAEHEVPVDSALFAAFVAGLLGDLLYWSARMRAGAQAGQQTWRKLRALLDEPAAPPGGDA